MSVTFKATVDGKQIERTVTPDEKGMPGIFRDVFNSIRFYLLHNPNPLPNQPATQTHHVYSRPECVFHYCPHPEECKKVDKCLTR